jgi:hypothetical protein
MAAPQKEDEMAITRLRLEQIKASERDAADFADGILEGNIDNYDGADGARAVAELCDYIEELMGALEGGGLTNG